MFLILVCLVTLQQVHSTCVLQDTCTELASVQDGIVDLHNQLRRIPPAADMLKMTWSDDLAANAQAWVDRCQLEHGAPSTRMLNGYELGENLYYSSIQNSWNAVINAWYNEVQKFRYPNESDWRDVGHYTQVIWSSSYRVGCGMTKCPNNIYFYGCHYYRAGNFARWPPYTEGEPCAMCLGACDDKLCTNPCPDINHFINCPKLKNYFGCNAVVTAMCPASCKCSNHDIIPIAKK